MGWNLFALYDVYSLRLKITRDNTVESHERTCARDRTIMAGLNDLSEGGTNCLVLLSEVLFLTLSLSGLGTNLLEILLKGGKILTGLGEFSLLHTLTDVPVNEGTLGVHKIELVVNTGKSLGDGSGVGHHAHGTLDTGKISTGDNGRRLVVNTALETSGAPVNELHSALGLDGGNGGVDILGDNVTSEHHATSHVLTVTGIALGKHVGGLEHGVGDLRHRKLLVVSLLSRDDRGIRGKHEVNSGVRHKVGLELRKIDVEGTIETKGSGQGGHNLGNESVQVGVGRALDVEVATAHVVKGLVIKAEGAISVLQQRVGSQHVVVRLNNSGRHLGGRGHGEGKLGLAAVIDRKTLQKEGSETGTRSTTGRVEDHETLKTGTVIGQLTDTVKDQVNNLLADGVVTTGVVVGSILLTGDQLLRVVKLTVGTGTDLVTHSGLKINHDATGNVLASTSLREKGVEGIVTATDGLVGRHLSVRLDTVLEAVKLPASVTGLDTGLAYSSKKTRK